MSLGSAVASRAADLLHVLLQRAGVVREADEPHVRLVDAHAESGRRHHRLDAAAEEVVLDARPLLRFEPGVVVRGAKAVADEHARELLGRAARARVDDRRPAAQPAQPLDEDAQAILGVRHLLDVVAEVRAHDRGRDDLGLPAERDRLISFAVSGVAVAVIPSSVGSPSSASARRMKR